VDQTTTLRESARPASSFVYSLGFILLLTFASGIICELTLLFLQLTELKEQLPPLVTLVIVPASGGLVFPLVVIRTVYGQTLRQFGIRWIDPEKPWRRWLTVTVIVVLLGWIVIWLSTFALVSAVAGGSSDATSAMSPGDLQAKNPLYQWLRGEDGAMAAVLHQCVLVGFLEELFGRGLLVNALDRRYQRVWQWRRWSMRQSTLLASVLFAVWHINWLSSTLPEIVAGVGSMLLLWPASLLLCVAYEKTRSLAVTVTLHNILDGGKVLAWYAVGLLWVR
jgi:membrane protease YdiL (CAAX protease family)